MNFVSILLLLVIGDFISCTLGQELEFFVSNNDGSDSWDGTSETNVDGSDVGPWRTLNHAIEEIRKLRPNPPSASDHITISMLPGKYFLTSEVNPICLPSLDESNETYEGKSAIVAGWGMTEKGETSTKQLMHVEVPIISNSQCLTFYSWIMRFHIQENLPSL